MPLQNRVDPFGELFITPARAGCSSANRGGPHPHRRQDIDPAALGVAAVDLLRC